MIIKLSKDNFESALVGLLHVPATSTCHSESFHGKIYQRKVTVKVKYRKRFKLISGRFILVDHLSDRESSGLDVYKFIPNKEVSL